MSNNKEITLNANTVVEFVKANSTQCTTVKDAKHPINLGSNGIWDFHPAQVILDINKENDLLDLLGQTFPFYQKDLEYQKQGEQAISSLFQANFMFFAFDKNNKPWININKVDELLTVGALVDMGVLCNILETPEDKNLVKRTEQSYLYSLIDLPYYRQTHKRPTKSTTTPTTR